MVSTIPEDEIAHVTISAALDSNAQFGQSSFCRAVSLRSVPAIRVGMIVL
jgi:hypothetical protein